MIQDIAQRKEAEAALLSQAAINEHQALHDPLPVWPTARCFTGGSATRHPRGAATPAQRWW